MCTLPVWFMFMWAFYEIISVALNIYRTFIVCLVSSTFDLHSLCVLCVCVCMYVCVCRCSFPMVLKCVRLTTLQSPDAHSKKSCGCGIADGLSSVWAPTDRNTDRRLSCPENDGPTNMSNTSANDPAHYEQVGSQIREWVFPLRTSGTFRTNDYVIYVMRL